MSDLNSIPQTDGASSDPVRFGYTNRYHREGKSTKEALRCHQRYIARDIYYTLRSDPGDFASKS